MSGAYSQHTDLNRICKFKEIADRISAIASEYEVEIKGYHSPNLPLFSSLSTAKQNEVLRQLDIFLKSMESAKGMGERLDSNERSLWHALRTLGIVPKSDMFSRFEPDDVIEIYDLQGIQIWRNFNFMKICSYTLEEMYTIEWHHRYARDAEKSFECMGKVADVISGKTPEIYFGGIPEHVLKETSSVRRYCLEARHDWLGRLMDSNGNLIAWFVTSKVRVLGENVAAAKSRPQLSIVPSL